MAIFYDFKYKVARQFASLLRRTVKVDDIEFGAPSSAPAGSSYNTQVTLKDRVTGQTRVVTYNRTPLSDLIEATIPTKIKTLVIGRASHSVDLVPLLNLQLGLPCSNEDIVQEAIGDVATYTVKASPNSLQYTGSCVVGISRQTSLSVRPDYEWGVNGSLANTGLQYGFDLGATFRQIDVDGVTYVGSAVGVYGVLPLSLPAAGNYTLDFEVIAEPYAAGGTLGVIFNGGADATVRVGALLTANNGAIASKQNCPYLHGVGYTNTTDFANITTTPLTRTARRLTLVRNGTSFSLYENGLLAWSGVSSATTIAWTHFGRSDDRLLCFRNMRFWNRALTNAERDQVIALNARPDWEFLLTSDSRNSGRLNYTPFTELGPALVPSAKGSTLRYPGVSLIDPRLAFPVNSEFTLEFDVILDGLRSRRVFLSTNPATPNAPGSLVFENNRLVEIGITPQDHSSLPTIEPGFKTRISLRSVNGVHEVYINGIFATSYPAPASATPVYLSSFRDTGAPDEQWLATDLVANLRYWQSPITPVVEGLPVPTNWFKLEGDASNVGAAGLPMSVPFTYTKEFDRTWAHVPGTAPVPFGNNCRIKTSGDYTIDFELLLDISYGSYLYTLTSGVAGTGAADTAGTLAFHANRLYEYLVTPTSGGDFAAGLTTIPVGEPVRITIRSRNGYSSVWINGVYKTSYPAAASSAGTYLTAFRNADSGVAQMPTGIGIRNLRSWETGLDNSQLGLLFGYTPDPLLPLHHWPLDGRTINLGRETHQWKAAVTYETYNDQVWAVSASASGSALGVSLDTTKDFTMQFDTFNPVGAGVGHTFDAWFHNQSNATGGLYMGLGEFYINGSDARYSSRQRLEARESRRVTLRRSGTRMDLWVDEYYMGHSTAAGTTMWDYLGYSSGYRLTTDWKFAGVKFWDRALSQTELQKLVNSNLIVPELVAGLSNLSGNTTLLDGSFTYPGGVFNAKSDPTVIGSLPVKWADKYIYGLYYYYASDSGNYLKKVKNIYLDQLVNGVWTVKASKTTRYVMQDWPGRDTINFEVPVQVPANDLSVRIRTVGNWNDPNGYRWVSDMYLLMGDAPKRLGTWWNAADPKVTLTGDTSVLQLYSAGLYSFTKWRQSRPVEVVAEYASDYQGKSMVDLDLWFPTGVSAELVNKPKYICVDTQVDGVWVEQGRVSTSVPTLNGPINQRYKLSKPIPVPADGKFRIRTEGNHSASDPLVVLYAIEPWFE